MGKNNQARRAAKAKQRARQRAQSAQAGRARDTGGCKGAAASDPGPAFDEAQAAELMWAAAGRAVFGRELASPAAALARLADLPVSVALTAAERVLRDHLSVLWRHGWQPLELIRHARLDRSGAPGRLVETAVAVDCTHLLTQTLDPRWRDQAEQVRLSRSAVTEGWLSRWATTEGQTAPTIYPLIADALNVVFELPPLEELIAPPGTADRPTARRTSTSDPVLQRVRSLLAKAESTEFEAEAIALTAKAQELITRHAIDAALLEADATEHRSDGPTLTRIPVDPPYADAKSLLLQTVAEATRCRTLSMPSLHMSTVIGLPDDLVAVEVLFTSLLVQAQHALTEAGRAAGPGTRPRSQSFRSAFLLAYAGRIGERLREINDHVFDTAAADSARFLPVLRAQHEAVDDLVKERFGSTTVSAVRGGYDSAGWASGRLAADRARLDSGDLEASST